MPLRLLTVAWLLELGSWFGFLAAVSALEAAGGAAWVSSYFVLYNGVQLVFAPLFGPLLDRVDRGRALGGVALLPLLALVLALVKGGLWGFLAVGVAYALTDWLYYNLVPAALPRLVTPHRLSRANALWSVGSGFLFLAAPAAAGAWTERAGAAGGLWVAGGAALLALLLGLGLSTGAPEPATGRGGWRALFGLWPAWYAALAVFLLALGGGVVNAALPVLTGGGRDYGFLLSAMGAGSLLASVLLAGRELARPLLAARIGLLLHALGDLGFALTRGVLAYLPFGLAKGVANVAFPVGLDTALGRRLPEAVLGRVFALGFFFSNLGQVLGAAAFGRLAGPVGPALLLFASAGLSLLALAPLARFDVGPAIPPAPRRD